MIAYGVSFIHDEHLASWRILFLIEGLPTILLAILIFLFLPSTPLKSRCKLRLAFTAAWTHVLISLSFCDTDLSQAEREVVVSRLEDPGHSSSHGFSRSAVKRALSQPTTYLNGLIYMGLNLTLASVSGFLPTIIESLGHTAAKAQLYTVPPYAVAFVCTVCISSLSDHFRRRGLFVILCMVLAGVGSIILLAVPHHGGVRYFATFLAVSGAFSNIPLMLSWAANTSGSQSAAAVRLGVMNTIGQSFSSRLSLLLHSVHSSTDGTHHPIHVEASPLCVIN